MVRYKQILASRKINWDNLIFSDELDPILGNIYNSTATKPSENYQRIYPSAGLIGTTILRILRERPNMII